MGNVDREHRVEAIQGEGLRALFPDDGDPAAVALQLPRDLGGWCQRVVLGGYRSDAHARVEGDERLRAVRQ